MQSCKVSINLTPYMHNFLSDLSFTRKLLIAINYFYLA